MNVQNPYSEDEPIRTKFTPYNQHGLFSDIKPPKVVRHAIQTSSGIIPSQDIKGHYKN